MTGKPHEIKNGRYWTFCPNCKEPHYFAGKHVHFGISLKTFTGYCYRCGYIGGIEDLTSQEISTLLNVTSEEAPKTERTILSTPVPGGLFGRPTALDVYHWNGFELFIRFDIRTFEPTGVHLRQRGSKGVSYGQGRGVGLSKEILRGEQFPFYRLVEGPYDALYPNDICLYGLPSKGLFRRLINGGFLPLVLCPDGDVWGNPTLLKTWFSFPLQNPQYFLYVERLPQDKDPDEVLEKQREKVPISALSEVLHKISIKDSQKLHEILHY